MKAKKPGELTAGERLLRDEIAIGDKFYHQMEKAKKDGNIFNPAAADNAPVARVSAAAAAYVGPVSASQRGNPADLLEQKTHAPNKSGASAAAAAPDTPKPPFHTPSG